MKKLSIAICVLASGISAPAIADTWLNLGGVSHHFETSWDGGVKYNESNLGLGIEHKMGGLNYMVGIYKNSLYNPSWYAVTEKIVYSNGIFGAGILGGMVNGYRLNDGGFIPAAALTATAEHNGIGARLMYMPGIKNVSAPVVSVQFRIRLD